MCSGNGRTAAALTMLVEEAVEARMKAREPFTALDVSNGLKARSLPVRHGEVAAAVREIFVSGAMAHYDYDRRLIDVAADGGVKPARTFLYLHQETKEREYTCRAQIALPPVPADQARALDDAVPANNPLSPFAAAGRARAAAAAPRQQHVSSGPRRDGALPIPRALARQAGWRVGDVLMVCADRGTPGGFFVAPAHLPPTPKTTARVWGELRVRLSKTKLAAWSLPSLSSLRFTVEGSVVRVLP